MKGSINMLLRNPVTKGKLRSPAFQNFELHRIYYMRLDFPFSCDLLLSCCPKAAAVLQFEDSHRLDWHLLGISHTIW